MTSEEIDELERVSNAATPGPWYVQERNDNFCMSAIVISTAPDDTEEYGFSTEPWREENAVAITLLEDGKYACAADRKWEENAELIVAMRNSPPDLIRLAKIAGQARTSE